MGSQQRAPVLNVYRMMERLGIDAAGGVVDQYSLAFCCAARACEGCGDVDACRAWLAAGETPRGAPAFCPNKDLLFELSCDVGHREAAAPAYLGDPQLA